MPEETKKEFSDMVDILKELDKESLLLMRSNAEILKARQDMDKKEEPVA